MWGPYKVISDNGTNFSSQLTQELLRRLGCSPLFAKPGHPQASGLVERFSRMYRDVLLHVVQQHGRRWRRVSPLARDVSADLGKPDEAYLTDLRGPLKKTADWAELHARHGQEVYTLHYNLRSKDKHFDEGDEVIVLDDDAAGKLC